jgi:signal peptidase I
MKFPRVLKVLWLDWLRPGLVAAAIICPLKSSLADVNFVPTGSMKPTILEGDFVFVNKLAYDLKLPFTTRHLSEWADPARGDVVVLFSPEDRMRLVKRVVAVPGDTIELRDNILSINGRRADYQPLGNDALAYVAGSDLAGAHFATETLEHRSHAVMAYRFLRSPMRSMSPLVLGPDEYFVMGDNRDNSKDSRYFGVVRRSLIVGRATGVVASVDKPGAWLPRLGRFFSALQ